MLMLILMEVSDDNEGESELEWTMVNGSEDGEDATCVRKKTKEEEE